MGWQVSVPEEPEQEEEMHPAVARTMEPVSVESPVYVLRFLKEHLYDTFVAFWWAYGEVEEGTEEEGFHFDVLNILDPGWDTDQDGFYDWEPNEERLLPTQAYAHVAAGGDPPKAHF